MFWRCASTALAVLNVFEPTGWPQKLAASTMRPSGRGGIVRSRLPSGIRGDRVKPIDPASTAQAVAVACSRGPTVERGQAGCELLQSALRIARLSDTQCGGLKVGTCFAAAFGRGQSPR